MTPPPRQRVLICTDWFTPGFKAGGPIRSLSAVIARLSGRFQFDVLTSDRDVGDTTAYRGIETDTWIVRDACLRVMYLSAASQNRRRIGQIIASTPWDCLYLNSMYSIGFTLFPLMAARRLKNRVVLAPRGMLQEGAMQAKRLKKQLFLTAFRLAKLHRRVTFQATDEQERADIQRVFGRNARIEIVPNVPEPLTPYQDELTKEPGRLRICCLARLSPKKNLHFLLERLADVTGEVVLSFYGPIEDPRYFAQCEEVAKRLPPSVRFEVLGPVSPDEAVHSLSRAHVFCLPTKGENFGHAIWEALAAGRPLVISDRTPWRNLQSSGAGWDLSLNSPDLWAATLSRLVAMDDAEWRRHASAARAFAEQYSRQCQAVQLTADLLTAHSPSPPADR